MGDRLINAIFCTERMVQAVPIIVLPYTVPLFLRITKSAKRTILTPDEYNVAAIVASDIRAVRQSGCW